MAVQLPPLVQTIVLDPTGVKAGAGAFAKSMGSVNKATDAANTGMLGLGNNLSTVAFRAQTAGRALRNKLGLPLVAIGALAAKSFADFEATMTRIESLVGISAAGVSKFADSVQEVSRETGRGPKELAEAMFFISSAGLRGAAATDVLNNSARAAALGLGQTKVVADAATSAINAYGIENLGASQATDVLVAAVREGKVEADRLAPAIGKAIPVASAMGIEFHEVAAAIASMTRTGTDARTSAIQLRQIMQSLLDPSRQATKALKEMGVAEGELRRQADEEGLLAVLKRLRDLSIENADAFADVFPNVRALAGALDITGANLEENEGIFRALANSTGDTAEGYAKVQKTIRQQVLEAFAKLQNAMIDLGKSMGPLVDVFVFFVEKAAALIQFFADNKWATATVAVFAALAVTVGTLATGFAVAAQMVIGFKTVMTSTIATATVLGTQLTALKLAMISTGIGALIVGLGTALAFVMKFGKGSKSAAKEAAELRLAIDDIRMVAGRAVKPLIEMGGALQGLSSHADPTVKAFFDTYADAINDAKSLGDDIARLQAEDSLLQMFFGSGDTEENRKALDTIVKNLQLSLRDFELFDRLFEGGDVSFEEAFTAFLIGEDTAAQTRRAIRTMTDRVIATTDDVFKEMGESLAFEREKNPAFDSVEWLNLPSEEELGQELAGLNAFMDNDLTDALEVPARILDQAMRSGRTQEFSSLWESIMTQAGQHAHLFGLTTEEMRMMVETNLMSAIHLMDDFTEDTGRGLDTLQGMLLAIAGSDADTRDFLLAKFDESGAEWWTHMAEAYEKSLRMLERERHEHEGMLDPLNRHNEALRLAGWEVEGVAKKQQGLNNVTEKYEEIMQDVLDDMATGFETANKNIKEFQRRWDMLIGTSTDFNALQREFRQGQTDLKEAFDALGGASLFNQSPAADAANEALEDQINLAGEFAAEVFGATNDMEQAEAALMSYLDAIARVAAGTGVNMDEFTEMMAGLQLTPESLQVITADANDPATAALIERASNMKKLGVSHFGPAGEVLGEALGDGVSMGIFNSDGELIDSGIGLMNRLITRLMEFAGISSPSQLTKKEIGEPIVTGIILGIEEKRQDLVNATREAVELALNGAKRRVTAVMAAIRAELDMQDAQARINKLTRDTAGSGISRREELMGKILGRRVKEAKRAMRLGQGHLDELQLAVLDAENAQEDFDQEARSGSELQRAQVALMQSGFDAAEAQAKMRMEGESAIGMFKELATTMGIAVGGINQLLDTGSDPNDMLSKIFSEDMIEKIEFAATEMAWIKEKAEELSNVTPPWAKWAFPDFAFELGQANAPTNVNSGGTGLTQSDLLGVNPGQSLAMTGSVDFAGMSAGTAGQYTTLPVNSQTSNDVIVQGDLVNNFGSAPEDPDAWASSIKNKVREGHFSDSPEVRSAVGAATGAQVSNQWGWVDGFGGYG
tara:strand:+ start:20694 stop:25016 length:4323 start_codon:yes stop_codon:yes gene_type:complete